MDPKYNPLDPRSSYFPLTLSIMEDEERHSRGPQRGPGCGCGCLVLVVVLLVVIVLISVH